jgi:DNA-binding beta-propeller fold protein YncE
MIALHRTSIAPLAVAASLAASSAAAQVAGLAGTLVVTNKSPSTATIIDVATGRALATLPTGPGPHEIVLSTNGATAVITDYGAAPRKTLTVLDVPGMRVTRTIDLGQYTAPHGIHFLPGDSLVAVTSEASSNVVIVHVADGAIRRAIPTQFRGSHMIGVTQDGARGYTGNMQAHTVSELDLRTGVFIKSFPVPNTPEAINVTPDGKEVWVGSNATGKVSVLDPASGTVVTAAEGVSWPYRVLFTPDAKTVVIPDMRNNEVRFIDRATRRELSRIATPAAGPQGITITPDGKYIFLSLSQQARVAIIDVAKREVAGHLPAGETPDGVAYTPRVVNPPGR